jgi:hypothetical protein
MNLVGSSLSTVAYRPVRADSTVVPGPVVVRAVSEK